MKKVLVLVSAMLMVATSAMAINLNVGMGVSCESTTPAQQLQINRGCEGEQTVCYPFDYEDNGKYGMSSYCTDMDVKTIDHKAILNVCECIPPEGDYWDNILTGDVINIEMELYVGKAIKDAADIAGWSTDDIYQADDQGVYWAENVNPDGIPLGVYPGEQNTETCQTGVTDTYFQGTYVYERANGTTASPNEGSSCGVADINRAVRIRPIVDLPVDDADMTYSGYRITAADAMADLSSWVVDIPSMRVDPSLATRDLGVYVKITLFKGSQADFTDNNLCDNIEIIGCPGYIYIGRLCCDPDGSLVYPYFPPASSTYWGLIGMTLTNVTDTAGEATVTVYETDGDVGMLDGLELGANETFLTTLAELIANADMEQIAGTGSLGDSRSYIEVKAPFDASGFVMIANPSTGESMGYLPIPYRVTRLGSY